MQSSRYFISTKLFNIKIQLSVFPMNYYTALFQLVFGEIREAGSFFFYVKLKFHSECQRPMKLALSRIIVHLILRPATRKLLSVLLILKTLLLFWRKENALYLCSALYIERRRCPQITLWAFLCPQQNIYGFMPPCQWLMP